MAPNTLLIAFAIEFVILAGLLLFFRRKVHWQILGENKSSHVKLRSYYLRSFCYLVCAIVLFTALYLQ